MVYLSSVARSHLIFVAESLDAEADKLPPGETELAEIFRKAAKAFRSISSRNSVRIAGETEDVNQAAAWTIREATERL